MSWATPHVAKLKAGETVTFRPHGNSMIPKIHPGQLCEVAPASDDIEVGNIVLCKVKGNYLVHLVTAKRGKQQYQISNNKGFVNGWITLKSIYGKLISVEGKALK